MVCGCNVQAYVALRENRSEYDSIVYRVKEGNGICVLENPRHDTQILLLCCCILNAGASLIYLNVFLNYLLQLQIVMKRLKKGSLWFKGIELKLADLKKKKANQNAQR